jgi:signal transduction histidine kinase
MQQVIEAFNTMVRELERRQDQLVQSKKLAAIGTLTAGVAHQLNNPLNNISTSCQIAIDELQDGDIDMLKRMLRNIDQETLRARDVVKGLLEFSREQEFSLRPTQLAETVRRAVRLVQSQVPADIAMVVDVPEELILPMDSQRMQEVFLNIIINAVQSIGSKGTIAISAGKDEKTDEVVIEIRDSGAGIPKEMQGRLFDPFYTTKEEGQGTGLGLSVVYGIIQKHHGDISVRSAPGAGASFFIRLPLIEIARAGAQA